MGNYERSSYIVEMQRRKAEKREICLSIKTLLAISLERVEAVEAWTSARELTLCHYNPIIPALIPRYDLITVCRIVSNHRSSPRRSRRERERETFRRSAGYWESVTELTLLGRGRDRG